MELARAVVICKNNCIGFFNCKSLVETSWSDFWSPHLHDHVFWKTVQELDCFLIAKLVFDIFIF